MRDRRDLDPRVQELARAYRLVGYRAARLDPLGLAPALPAPELEPAFHGLGPRDLSAHSSTDFAPSPAAVAAGDLIQHLRTTYAGPLALDCEHVRDGGRRGWLWQRMEQRDRSALLMPAQRLRTLERLLAAEAWERLLDRDHASHKRFSLAGCETLLPLLHRLVDSGAARGVEQVVLGMAHRGRLNVLVNLMAIPPALLLSTFAGTPDPALGAFDLKYHLGHCAQLPTDHGPVHVRLAYNPSHLESVDPVVCGMARALQDRLGERGRACVLPVLVHGDAAFCGQGVVMETMNLSQTRGYSVGGTVHVVLNNQVGFTTSDPRDARSMAYGTDVARLIDAPVLHVNADDPDSAAVAAQIAVDYRAAFGADIVIDLIGFRRHGHNEQDLPELTQPAMQRRIAAHPGLVATHVQRLLRQGWLDEAAVAGARQRAEARLVEGWTTPPATATAPDLPAISHPVTSLPLSRLRALFAQLATPPPGFTAHETVRQMAERWRRLGGDLRQPVDWCAAENLAYAAILAEGGDVRLTGMDVGRGTFCHRHARWHDQGEDAEARDHVPLQNLQARQGSFRVFDSPLSEEGVLGFEYGYSVLAGPGLVVWEAQYGDFVNNAQVVLDQYVSTGEAKWGYRSGLVILLPHGHEGIGPEHSCAYLGRFLQLCAEDNLRVAVPSTSAQLFHLLRRQALEPSRKPLVVMTPKSCLHEQPASHAPCAALVEGGFQPVIDDATADPARVRTVVLCAGKVHYDLLQARADDEVALVRLEQLYPFPAQALARVLARFPRLRELRWVQEEAKNHGAWYLLREPLEAVLPAGTRLVYVGRPAAAPSAVCYPQQHRAEQASLVAAALSTVRARAGGASPLS